MRMNVLLVSLGRHNHIDDNRDIWCRCVENNLAVRPIIGNTIRNHFVCQWIGDEPSVHHLSHRDVLQKSNGQNATVHRGHSSTHTVRRHVRHHNGLGIIFTQPHLSEGTTYAISTIWNSILKHFCELKHDLLIYVYRRTSNSNR